MITFTRQLGALLALALALQAIYVAYFGGWEPTIHRSVALFVCIAIVIAVTPLAGRYPDHHPLLRAVYWMIDGGMLAVSGYACWRLIDSIDDIENLMMSFSLMDQVTAILTIGVILELTRRVFGKVLALMGVIALVYVLFGSELPWIFHHSGYSLEKTVEIIWFGFQGVFGTALGIVLSLILVFIVLGALLEGTGAGDALIRIAFAATNKTRGGPAHAAIIASALFGSTSGSVTANVVGTGALTIPLIKRRGFSGAFAGGVEAAASTGGQIMPPVMGAAAFLMSDLTGVPYLTICLAALVPALFFYGSLFVAVSLQAQRLNIQPVPEEDRVKLNRSDFLKALMVIGPVLTIVTVLALGRSPATAGFWAIMVGMVLAFALNPELRAKPSKVAEALKKGGVAGAQIMIAVATIGVLLGVLNMTGIGLKFATQIAHLGSETLFLSLLLAALASLILGMGMPTLPAYLIIVLVLGPAIKLMGLPVLAVHLFVFYFGVLSAISPPIALAAIAAAPIAQANPISTAVKAISLTLVGFVVPFVFVYEPSLLLVLDFSWTEFLWIGVRMCLAIWLLNTACIGFDGLRLSAWSRLLRGAFGVAVVTPILELQLGVMIAIFALLTFDRSKRRCSNFQAVRSN